VSVVRGRRLTAIIAAGLVALAVGGCGGGDETAPQVPGDPADFAVPESTVEAPAGEDEATTDDGSTTDEDATTDDATGTTEETAPPTDTGATTPETSGGGTEAPATTEDSPTNDTAPPEGSEAEQFEDFCAQNPGAC
jgi:hypothetical protein